MHSLETIKYACTEALEQMAGGEDWKPEYCSVVDPSTTLEMVQRIEHLERAMSEEELQAIGKLIRDLTGYIKMHSGINPDPVRDDLLLQARQLLGVTGI
jgi:hypothetical protein